MKLNDLIKIVYSYTLLYLTLYGLTKSTSEYFCVNRRPGSTISDYTGTNTSSIIGIGRTPLFPLNGVCSTNGLDSSKGEWPYKIERWYNNGEGQIHMVVYIRKLSPIILKENGVVNSDVITVFNTAIVHLKKRRKNINCTFSASVQLHNENCNYRKSQTDRWIRAYYISTFILLTISTLSISGNKFVFPGLFMNMIFTLFDLERSENWDLCNEITGSFTFFKKENAFYILSRDPLVEQDGNGLETLETRKGLYRINKGVVTLIKKGVIKWEYKIKEKEYLFYLESKVKRAFYLLQKNPHFLPIENDSKNMFGFIKHHVSVEKVIIEICENGGILKQGKVSSWFISCGELEEIDNRVLRSLKIRPSETDVEILKFHNCNFFNETKGNFTALRSILKGNFGFWYKPKTVRNSAWKMYVEDIKLISSRLESKSLFNFISQYKIKTKIKGTKSLRLTIMSIPIIELSRKMIKELKNSDFYPPESLNGNFKDVDIYLLDKQGVITKKEKTKNSCPESANFDINSPGYEIERNKVSLDFQSSFSGKEHLNSLDPEELKEKTVELNKYSSALSKGISNKIYVSKVFQPSSKEEKRKINKIYNKKDLSTLNSGGKIEIKIEDPRYEALKAEKDKEIKDLSFEVFKKCCEGIKLYKSIPEIDENDSEKIFKKLLSRNRYSVLVDEIEERLSIIKTGEKPYDYSTVEPKEITSVKSYLSAISDKDILESPKLYKKSRLQKINKGGKMKDEDNVIYLKKKNFEDFKNKLHKFDSYPSEILNCSWNISERFCSSREFWSECKNKIIVTGEGHKRFPKLAMKQILLNSKRKNGNKTESSGGTFCVFRPKIYLIKKLESETERVSYLLDRIKYLPEGGKWKSRAENMKRYGEALKKEIETGLLLLIKTEER